MSWTGASFFHHRLTLSFEYGGYFDQHTIPPPPRRRYLRLPFKHGAEEGEAVILFP